MHHFTDGAGRAWTIGLTFNSIRRVKQKLGIDLTTIHDGSAQPLVARLYLDLLLVGEILAALVGPQLATVGVTPEEFGESLSGDALHAGQTALLEELVDFFQSLGRGESVEAITLFRTELLREIETAKQEMHRQRDANRSTSGSSASSLRDLSGCTPDDSA